VQIFSMDGVDLCSILFIDDPSVDYIENFRQRTKLSQFWGIKDVFGQPVLATAEV